MKNRFHYLIIALTFLLLSSLNSALAKGALTPPDAPAPTMKSLNQIEPRTPISTLPYTISNAGSYYLTNNLTGQAGANGITITTSDVTLDLNGFTIIGVAGSSDGIFVNGINAFNITIRNGTVGNWGTDGIGASIANSCQFDELRVSQNGTYGGITAINVSDICEPVQV